MKRSVPAPTTPLTIAVTGGIGSGKSTVSRLFAGAGAVVVDSDHLAREVVAPGTPGLAAVVEQFGMGVLTATGELDRAALAAIVFADPAARHALEAITHPLVRTAAAALQAGAGREAVVVNDIPILRDLAAAAHFHLVVGVGVPDGQRIARLIARGMSEPDARARIAAQITDDERRAFCDVWIDNSDSPDDLATAIGVLWRDRLRPFADHRLAGTRAARGTPHLTGPDPAWADEGRRLAARVAAAADGARVDHIGSTAITGLPATDVIDLQLAVPDLATADRLLSALAEVGFPARPGNDQDTPHPDGDDPIGWRKRFLANADPGRWANLHVRVEGSPGWRWALLFRDWLNAEPAVRDEYLTVKQAAMGPATIDDYAQAKEPWIARAYQRGLDWAKATGWTP